MKVYINLSKFPNPNFGKNAFFHAIHLKKLGILE